MIRIILIGLLTILSLSPTTLSFSNKIQVCQSKDCCRKFGSKTSSYYYNLPQILQDLSSSIEVEKTSCLSNCNQGPNMLIVSSSVILHGVRDHIQAAVGLENLGFTIPTQNIAAIAVLEKANQASCVADKETAFNSVIRTLESQGGSSVLARALVMRAESYYDSGRIQETLLDTQKALSMPISTYVSRRAWRLLVDAHTTSGQLEEAIQCLQDWMNHDPTFKTKINSEKNRLQQALKA